MLAAAQIVVTDEGRRSPLVVHADPNTLGDVFDKARMMVKRSQVRGLYVHGCFFWAIVETNSVSSETEIEGEYGKIGENNNHTAGSPIIAFSTTEGDVEGLVVLQRNTGTLAVTVVRGIRSKRDHTEAIMVAFNIAIDLVTVVLDFVFASASISAQLSIMSSLLLSFDRVPPLATYKPPMSMTPASILTPSVTAPAPASPPSLSSDL